MELNKPVVTSSLLVAPFCPICGDDLVADERFPGLLICPSDDPPHYMKETK